MIRPLTSLRFLAALAVFLSHLGVLQQSRSMEWAWERVFSQGYAGVTFFFVLSGFILTYAYAGRIERSFASIATYLAARVGRIWPVHLLTLVLAIPIAVRAAQADGASLVNGELIGSFLAQLLLVQSYVPIRDVYFSFNAPSWSLGNEMLFYALLPVVLIALTRRTPRIQTVYAIGVGAWALTTVGSLLARNSPDAHWLLYVNPAFRLFDFTIGVCLALVFAAYCERSAPRRTTNALWTWLEVGALVAVAGAVIGSAWVPHALTYGAWYQPAFAAVVMVFAFARGRITNLLSSRALVYLGEISFCFYMLHVLVIGYLGQVLPGTDLPIPFSIIALLVTIAASAIVHHWYEDPLRLRIARAAKQRWHPGTPRPVAVDGLPSFPHASPLGAPSAPAPQEVVSRR